MSHASHATEPTPTVGPVHLSPCAGCGTLLHPRALACPKCGAPGKGVKNSDRTRNVAMFLTVLAGPFGIHKFYLGRRFAGWWYLLFFWTLVPAFFALFDLVKLACMGSAKFDETYNMDNA